MCLLFIGINCRSSQFDFTTNRESDANAASVDSSVNAPPFATKEPEKYAAKIVFASKYGDENENFIEQTSLIARDGNNRRLDFAFGERQFTHLQLADGKQFVMLTREKVYAEIRTPDEVLLTNQPSEFALEHLLHTKPAGASYQKIGEETILNRRTIKYKLDFGAMRQAENARTETFVWADEDLGLPIKTEIVALDENNQSGARNVVELREIKIEVDAKLFELPKDFRKISFPEVSQLLKDK